MRAWLSALIACCICLSMLGFSTRGGAAAGMPQANMYAPGQILVGLKQKSVSGSAVRLNSLPGTEVQMIRPEINLVVMRVQPGSEMAALDQLRMNAGVAFAEPNYIAQAQESAFGAPYDDPRLAEQWALEMMGVPFTWEHTHGSSNVLVAVLDSGVQLAHDDLQGQIWTNPGEIPGNGVDDDLNGKVDDVHGWHFYNKYVSGDMAPAEDALVEDDTGHGTRVAGIIAARANNGLGIAGIAPAAQVLPVKVLDSNNAGYYSDIAAGIVYAADQGARIINLSLGGYFDSVVLREAVAYARARGALVVAAAGNCSGPTEDCAQPVMYPAAIEEVIAVAASDTLDTRAIFSRTGPEVDLAAPGVNILSTNFRNNYFSSDGTSFAAPQVSGVAALLLGYQPALAPGELETLLMTTAQDIDAPGKDDYSGWGRVSANHALGKLAGLADLWVTCQASEQRFIVRYGNGGYSAASGARVDAEITRPDQTSSETSWMAGEMPAGEAPQELALDVPDAARNGIIALDLRISSTSVDYETRNNQTSCQIPAKRLLYFPIVNFFDAY